MKQQPDIWPQRKITGILRQDKTTGSSLKKNFSSLLQSILQNSLPLSLPTYWVQEEESGCH